MKKWLLGLSAPRLTGLMSVDIFLQFLLQPKFYFQEKRDFGVITIGPRGIKLSCTQCVEKVSFSTQRLCLIFWIHIGGSVSQSVRFLRFCQQLPDIAIRLPQQSHRILLSLLTLLTLCQHCAKIVLTMCQHFVNNVSTSWWYFVNTVSTLCQYCINIVSTFCQTYSTSIVSIFDILFIWGPSPFKGIKNRQLFVRISFVNFISILLRFTRRT